MKRYNQFSQLPQEDKDLILNLCEKYPYTRVVEILAKPRSEGGLSFITSRSSVCRFYTWHHPERVAAQALSQYATAIQVQHQAEGESNLEAIFALVQNRILAALREGKSVAELERDFRTLERLQKCFLTDSRWRGRAKATRAAYCQHLKDLTILPEADYMRNDVRRDPGAPDHTPEHFNEMTQWEVDMLDAGHEAGCRASAFEKEAGTDPDHHRKLMRELRQAAAEAGEIMAAANGPNAAKSRKRTRRKPSKTPAISHIPDNFTNPNSTNSANNNDVS